MPITFAAFISLKSKQACVKVAICHGRRRWTSTVGTTGNFIAHVPNYAYKKERNTIMQCDISIFDRSKLYHVVYVRHATNSSYSTIMTGLQLNSVMKIITRSKVSTLLLLHYTKLFVYNSQWELIVKYIQIKKKNYTKLEPVFTCPDRWYNQSMEAITTFFFMKQCQVSFFKDKNNQRLIIQFIIEVC